jgi:hypothetical protein
MHCAAFVPAVVVGGLACALAWGQEPLTVRPQLASRLVESFDFEERLTNPNPVPRHWSRVYDAPLSADAKPVRPTLPKWNKAELVFAKDGHPAASGEGSVCLPTIGGSTRLGLDPGVIPVFVGADYRVLAKVQTKGLQHARARVLVRFVERDGTPIVASERASDLVVSADEWTSIALELVGEHPRAAFLQVQLDLLQPGQFGGSRDPSQAALREDFSGSAYFDDIEVIQLPRAEVTTSAPLNLGVWPDVPSLVARVRDLTGERLTARLETFDSRGVLVDAVEKPIDGAERIQHTPKVSVLGWYRTVMTIRAGASPIAVDSVDFGVVPAMSVSPADPNRTASRVRRVSSQDRTHFGVIAGPLPDGVLGSIVELPRRIGTGALTLDATGASTASNSPLARAVADVLHEWQDVTLVVTRLDITSAASDRPLTALGSTKEALAALEPLLDRFGQRVRRYQFARVGDDQWFWEPESHDPEPVVRALRRYVSGPIVSMPMRVDRRPWIGTSESVDAVFFVPAAMTPEAVGEAVGVLRLAAPKAGEHQPVTLAFECAPEGLYSPRSASAHMVRRAVEAWVAAPVAVPNMSLVEPWTVLGSRRPQFMPRAELVAWRSLADRLLDRRVIARIPAHAGTRAYLLAPHSGAPAGTSGAIVAWNESAAVHGAFLEGFFGSGNIRLVDIFGNETVPSPAPLGRSGLRGPSIRVPLTEEPVFIEGVDTALVQFLSDFRLEPEAIEPGSSSGDHRVVLRNPFSTGISGTITLLSPSREESEGPTREWKVNPRVMRFAVGPQESATIPLSIAAGSGLELGPQAFVFQVELSAENQYPRLEISRDVIVGLSNVRVDLSYRLQGTDDLVLEVALANISTLPLNMSITAFAPQQARQTGTISNLPPTNQSIRRFLYPGLASQLRGKRLSISLLDADSNVRVAASLLVE